MKKIMLSIFVAIMLLISGCGNNESDVNENIENVCSIIMNAPDPNFPQLENASETDALEKMNAYVEETKEKLTPYVDEKAMDQMFYTVQVPQFSMIASQLSLSVEVKKTTVEEGKDNHHEFATEVSITKDDVNTEEVIKGIIQTDEDGKIDYFKITELPEILTINKQ